MFRLNRNKQKTNRNSFIGSIYCYFVNTVAPQIPLCRRMLGLNSGLLPLELLHLDAWIDLGCPVFLVFWFFSLFLFFSFFSSFFRFFGLFRNSLFRLFRFYTETESLKDSIYGNYSENLGLFRFDRLVMKQICLFRLF